MLIDRPDDRLPSVEALEAHLAWLLAETRATRDYLRTARRVAKWRAATPLIALIERKEAERAGTVTSPTPIARSTSYSTVAES